MRRVRLVIADRRPIVLQGFASLLGAQPDFEKWLRAVLMELVALRPFAV
jgi:hypothetical protein